MESKFVRIPGGIVYPGLYVPGYSEHDLRLELSKAKLLNGDLPPVNICHQPDCIRVEMAIPGMKREDFMVHADENILSIFVLHKEPIYIEEKDFRLHEFNYTCIDRQVVLPNDADVSFISAEYKDGILCIIIPKSVTPVSRQHADIVVY
ncbi:MAG: Hsp20/alpha crystallin family protein [Ferruginibacter sp.]